MPTDVMVILQDRPGELARLGEATAAAGIHIRGLASFTGESHGVAHVLVDDAEASRAQDALTGAGLGVADTMEVLLVDVAYEIGTLGELARTLTEAGVNIDFAYSAFGGTRVVIGTDDLASARAALSS
jgi:hypothetical protein